MKLQILSLYFSFVVFCIFLVNDIFCQITVTGPSNLKSKISQEIKAGFANFGKFPYGRTIKGKLIYNKYFNGCDDHNLYSNTTVLDSAIVLLSSENANCDWTQRVLNVEKIGGHVALMILDKSLWEENLTQYFVYGDYPSSNKFRDIITIPSMVINKEDADKLIKYILENLSEQISLDIDFSLHKENNKVIYEILFSSGDSQIYDTLKELYSFQKAIGEDVKLIPHYITFTHQYFDEVNPQFIETYIEDCVCGGRYCVSHKKNITGREIILENIRQQCIYDYSYIKTTNTSIYWNYMDLFSQACNKKNKISYIQNLKLEFDIACSEVIANSLGVPNEYLENCIDESFNPKGIGFSYGAKTVNNILEREKKTKKVYDNLYRSQLVINQKAFFSGLNLANIKQAICAGFKSKPAVCFEEGYSDKDDGFGFGTFIWVLIAVVVLNIIIFLLCKRYMLKRIQNRVDNKDFIGQINNSMSSYNKINEKNEVFPS